jgi:IS30 family transposase
LRIDYGHWEADLIIGRRANGFDNLLTFTERKSRIGFIARVKTKNPFKVNATIYKLIKDNNLEVKSITIDNGLEFQKIGILAG